MGLDLSKHYVLTVIKENNKVLEELVPEAKRALCDLQTLVSQHPDYHGFNALAERMEAFFWTPEDYKNADDNGVLFTDGDGDDCWRVPWDAIYGNEDKRKKIADDLIKAEVNARETAKLR